MCWCGCTLCGVIVLIVYAAADSKAPLSSWQRPQQSVMGLMVSIDDTLRNIGSVRWDVALEQIDHRLETLEIKIRRLDTVVQDRLDKIERQLNSRDLKADISEEKLSHKIREVLDANYDRYNRRLTYTEERFELMFKKLETSIVEGSLNRLEKQQEDIQSEMIEMVATLEDLKTHSAQSEDKFNTTHKTIQQHLQTFLAESPSRDQLQKISGSLEHIGNKLNNSVSTWGSQNDGPLSCTSKDLLDTLSVESHKISNKMSNMYNDVWRRLLTVESQIKEVIKLGNTTQREVLEEFRSALSAERKEYFGDSQENFLEVALDALERKIQKKISEMGRKFDDKFDTMSATQNLVMDSCFEGGICQGLESRVSNVLEKIYEMFSGKIETFSNGTSDLDNLLVEMMELVKNQHTQLIRTVSHTTNMVVTLTKETNDANKQLQSKLVNMAERTDVNLQEIQDEMQDLNSKICLDNSEEEKILTNITEVHLSPINLTITQTEENEPKGILKITEDNLITENITSVDDRAEQDDSKLRYIIDDSTEELMELLNPNLTSSQIKGLMRFLNNSINLNNIEAIIQNTQADPKLVEETTEKEIKKFTNLTMLLKSIEIKPLNNTEADHNPETSTQIESSTLKTEELNTTLPEIEEKKTETNKLINPFINQIQLLSLIIKIQKGVVNTTGILDSYQAEMPNARSNYLETLCFGTNALSDMNFNALNLRKRERLLQIKSVIKRKSIYEKIEDICNILTDKLVNHL